MQKNARVDIIMTVSHDHKVIVSHRRLLRLPDGKIGVSTPNPPDNQESTALAAELVQITSTEQLAALIKRARTEKRISQEAIAALAALSDGTIKNAEKGGNIGIAQMFRILNVLGITLYA